MSNFQGFTGFCWIFVLIISCFICCAKSRYPTCHEAVFETVKKGTKPLEEDVISSHYVSSWFECGEKCLESDDCVTFSHSTTLDNEINCKIASESMEIVVKHGVDTWTTYELREAEPEICSTQQPCKNGGCCVRDACEQEGYMCMCSEWYRGKHCENENSDFDVLFSSQEPVLSYIQMDSIKSDLTQFTFTVWFKFAVGLQQYHLISYKGNDEKVYIHLSFTADSQSVNRFVGEIIDAMEVADTSSFSTPVNDNVWHHLGFAWSNKNGRWDFLIDGTPRGLRDSVENGKSIPGEGTLVIGQHYTNSVFKAGEGFLGKISGLNIWDKALTGQELEAIAAFSGNEQGNILRWFNIPGNIFGNAQVAMPSNAQNTNKGLDFELQFSSNSSKVSYILSPGPVTPLAQLSICLWLKSNVTSTFVSYDVEGETGPAFSFGIATDDRLFGNINGSLAKSDVSNEKIVNNEWHFICITWDGQNGNVIFYYESEKQNKNLISGRITLLSQGGKFSVGVTKDQNSGTYASSFIGKLSCLNVWSYIQSPASILSMSSGGMNVNGDYLQWRDVPRYIVGCNLVVMSNTMIYYPGYSLLAERSEWCNDHVTTLSCGTLYARLGEGVFKWRMAWRCYCATALHKSKYAYKFASGSDAYKTKHDELLAIN